MERLARGRSTTQVIRRTMFTKSERSPLPRKQGLGLVHALAALRTTEGLRLCESSSHSFRVLQSVQPNRAMVP